MVVLQGCYDAGVIYLKDNAAVLIALALVIALNLVCNTMLFHSHGSILLMCSMWPTVYIRMSLCTYIPSV